MRERIIKFPYLGITVFNGTSCMVLCLIRCNSDAAGWIQDNDTLRRDVLRWSELAELLHCSSIYTKTVCTSPNNVGRSQFGMTEAHQWAEQLLCLHEGKFSHCGLLLLYPQQQSRPAP